MSRTEAQMLGSIPLHTLEADVDYGFATSYTTYGTIGVKVWVYRGMFGEQQTEADQTAELAMTRARRRREGRADRPARRGPERRPAEAAPAPAEAPAPPAEPPPAEAPQAG